MRIRVADYIAEHLEAIGVRAIFLLSGGMMMHLIDAVGRRPAIRYLCNHHEQASAMAADAYARITGRLGVCYATSGPGATNLLTGVVGAWQDSSPVLFLTGQSKAAETIRGSGIAGLRQFGVFEVDIVPIVESVTKYAVFLRDPETVRYHLEKAIHLATTGRPGPVLIDIPLDVQGALIDPDELAGYEPEPVAVERDEDSVARALLELHHAERPLILAGLGVRASGAAETFLRVARRVGIPVVTTPMGKDLLEYADSLFIGHPGPKGDRAGNHAVQSCDVLLTVGTSLHIQTTGFELDQFAPNACKIQVEIDPAIRARENVGVRHKIAMDTRAFLETLERGWGSQPWQDSSGWRQQCLEWKSQYPSNREPHEIAPDNGPANLYEFVDRLSEALTGNETVVLDAGQPYYAMAQGFRLRGRQRYIASASLGAMGVAVPFSIGAAVARPEAPVICVTGDGSFHLNVQELQTIRHFGLNVKIFVIDNDGYASIRATQRTFFSGNFVGSTVESGVTLPPLTKIAEAYGIPYVACRERHQLGGATRRALSLLGPAICGITALRDQKIIPAVPSYKLPDGRMKSRTLDEMAPELTPRPVPAGPEPSYPYIRRES